MTRPELLKQKNMTRVLLALTPIFIISIYYFGWRIAGIVAVSLVSSFLTEWFMVTKRKGKVTYACFVTATLYALSLPPTVPFWIVVVGAIVAILFAKEAFGGFGKNVFNPAIVGRAFVFVCFPIELTSRFVPAFQGFPGGFAAWSFTTAGKVPAYVTKAGLTIADAVTSATPMWSRRDFGFSTDIINLIFGNITGTFSYKSHLKVLGAGSTGEVCAVVLIISALYLVITKTAQWRLMVASLLGATAMAVLLRTILGIDAVPPLLFSIFSGGLIYATVFMVTDPVSAPKQSLSQWVYGLFIGAMIIFFRYKAVFVGGVGFAILLGNMLAPSLDLWLKRLQKKPQKEKSA